MPQGLKVRQMPPPGFAGAVIPYTPRRDAVARPITMSGIRRHTNKNKRQIAMFRQPKIRQASLIVFATTVILILPNLTRLVS
ncbi:hypothetical protein HP532_17755 [Pseudomonas sp. CrR25]|nr:hypothetical protein [Pseudomonas sp. CrR25]